VGSGVVLAEEEALGLTRAVGVGLEVGEADDGSAVGLALGLGCATQAPSTRAIAATAARRTSVIPG
jgi:hypothetical protein